MYSVSISIKLRVTQVPYKAVVSCAVKYSYNSGVGGGSRSPRPNIVDLHTLKFFYVNTELVFDLIFTVFEIE